MHPPSTVTRIVALALCVACASEDPPTGATITPAREVLLDQPTEAAVALPDGRALVASEGDLLLVRGAGDASVVGSAEELGEVRTVDVSGDTTLVVGTRGAFALQGDAFFASPLEAALPDETILGIVATPRDEADVEDDLWVLTDARLYLFRNERLRPLTIEGASFDEDGLLATAPLVRGRSVWVRAGDQVLEVWMRAAVLNVGVVQTGFVPDAMVADGAGSLWMTSEGSLHELRSDRRLRRWAMPFAVDSLRAAGGGAWFAGEGQLWHHTGGRFHPVEGAGEVLGAGAGSAFAGGDALVELLPRHRVSIGVEDGTRIVSAAAVPLQIPNDDRVTDARATLGGESIEVFSDPWRVELDPDSLEPGAYELALRVRYDDGTLEAEASRSLQVGIEATWGDQIRAVYVEHCSACHGATGPAPTRLDGAERWEAEFDAIVFNVREGRMPLGRPLLDPSTISLIEAWGGAGFPR